ncbi:MAG: nucleotidyltransferase domain-containing protein [Candidatus Puniceispirillales bacterium WSBS_2018_MAG_OTU23]
MNHGLTNNDLDIMKQILLPYRDDITQISLFGSRATGLYRDNSDIDLVIYSKILDENDQDRLYTLFQDSLLAKHVDPLIYQWVNYSPLKQHIDTSAKILWMQDDLKALAIDDHE